MKGYIVQIEEATLKKLRTIAKSFSPPSIVSWLS
jgi:hypothetical protein